MYISFATFMTGSQIKLLVFCYTIMSPHTLPVCGGLLCAVKSDQRREAHVIPLAVYTVCLLR